MERLVLFVVGSFWVGRWTTIPKQPRRITLVEDVAAPEFGPGFQHVTVEVRPPPFSEETVQVWIKEGDTQWYRCTPAIQLANNGFWKARCRFGIPGSNKEADKAKNGQNWFA